MAEAFEESTIIPPEPTELTEADVRAIVDQALTGVTGIFRTKDGKIITLAELLTQTQRAFGGDGSDGDLIIESGTTTIDLGGVNYFTKNYSSISIIGTGKLAFSNAHSKGTNITLKCKNNVTITSSGSPTIDLASLGASGGTAGNIGSIGTSIFFATGAGDGGSVGVVGQTIDGGAGGTSTMAFISIDGKLFPLSCGAGGGGGNIGASGGSGGTGGLGGGGLLIECRGDLNFGASSDINLDGAAGAQGDDIYSAGGGGGGGGVLIISYANLIANAGSVSADGGDGGAGTLGVRAGGSGGSGQSIGGNIPNGGDGGNATVSDAGTGGGGGAGGGGGNPGSDGTGTNNSNGAGGGGAGGGAWAIIQNTNII
jgi:hypothetical protein